MNPTATPFTPSSDPIDDLAFAEGVVRGGRWFEIAGIAEHWPLNTGEAASLLTLAGQYATDAEDLVDLIERRIISSPGVGETGYEWSAQDILAAVAALEGRGQWQATPSKHDVKKHACRTSGWSTSAHLFEPHPRSDSGSRIQGSGDSGQRELHLWRVARGRSERRPALQTISSRRSA